MSACDQPGHHAAGCSGASSAENGASALGGGVSVLAWVSVSSLDQLAKCRPSPAARSSEDGGWAQALAHSRCSVSRGGNLKVEEGRLPAPCPARHGVISLFTPTGHAVCPPGLHGGHRGPAGFWE